MLLICLAAAVKSPSTAEDASMTHFDACTSTQIPHNDEHSAKCSAHTHPPGSCHLIDSCLVMVWTRGPHVTVHFPCVPSSSSSSSLRFFCLHRVQCATLAVVHKTIIMTEAVRKYPSYITPATGQTTSHNQHPYVPNLAFSTLRSNSLPDDELVDHKACVHRASCLPDDG